MSNKTVINVAAATLLIMSGGTSAFAETEEKLAGSQLEGYLKGSTVYVDIQPGGPFGKGGLSPFYYGHDGRFAAQLSTGKITGSWKLSSDASYCIDIAHGDETFCTDVIKKGSSIEHHSVGLKRLMGPVVRIVPGNDADL